jgi:hypothetical protein
MITSRTILGAHNRRPCLLPSIARHVSTTALPAPQERLDIAPKASDLRRRAMFRSG